MHRVYYQLTPAETAEGPFSMTGEGYHTNYSGGEQLKKTLFPGHS